MPPTPKDPAAEPGQHRVVVHGISHGMEGVARLPDGRACFVPYALPGETVDITVTQTKKRWARGELVAVVEASPDRVTPPCPYAGPWPAEAPTCGGCALQHAQPQAQLALKHRVLVEQLERIGRFSAPPVREPVPTGPWGYRSRARFAVDDHGQLGFREPGSHAVRPVDRCPLLTPQAQALREAAGDAWPGVESVEVHAGSQGSGGLLVRPGPDALPPLPAAAPAVAVVDAGPPVALRGDPTAIEEVAGLALQVSSGVFFQAGPEAAEALVATVREAAGSVTGRHVLDLYAGVGLFAAALAADGAHVTAVEHHRGAVRDARRNLEAASATVVAADVGSWLADHADEEEADVVVLDPPRRGAGPAVCEALPRLGARRVVYVSCDPAALARDARTLADLGARLLDVTPVDCFPHTAAIESVATFELP